MCQRKGKSINSYKNYNAINSYKNYNAQITNLGKLR